MNANTLKLNLMTGAAILVGTLGAAAATNTVHFAAFYFAPSTVNITAGDTVVWTEDALGSHTVTGTGADPICGTGTVGSGCSHTFATSGIYPYICATPGHAGFGMTGLVLVASAPVPPTPAVLTNMTILPNGLSQFEVFSTAQHTNLVQASTNLSVSNWTTISTVVPETTNFIVIDSNAPNFQLRFYRVVQP